MLFRQLFDLDSSTYTYLLADTTSREAVIIDPVLEQFERDRSVIEELGLTLRYVLETHVHADHVTASGLLREHFGARSVVSERAGVVCPDWQVKQGDTIVFGRHRLEVRETPGHTSGCVTYVEHEVGMAFTGDALLIRGCGRTDFQAGDSPTLYRSVHEQIFTLPESTLIYPGHDYKGRTVSSVGEELRHNPRLGRDKSVTEFTRIMSELKLPYPKKIDAALPANARCGLSPSEVPLATPGDTSWAPIAITAAGVPEVSSAWLASAGADVQRVDVRETDEFLGELGHIPGAKLIPLGSLRAGAEALSKELPVVTICRSGGRSGRAVVELSKLGFTRLASLRGGMLDWNVRKLPVERGLIQNRQG